METVGQATWSHSVRSLKPGGRIVISGATSGDVPPAELTRIFFTQLSVVGSTMGTRDQLGRLLRFCEQTGTRPLIDRVIPLAERPGRLRGDDRRDADRQDRLHPVVSPRVASAGTPGYLH